MRRSESTSSRRATEGGASRESTTLGSTPRAVRISRALRDLLQRRLCQISTVMDDLGEEYSARAQHQPLVQRRVRNRAVPDTVARGVDAPVNELRDGEIDKRADA